MQFAPGYQNVETPLFSEVSPPLHNNTASASWLHVPPMHMPWGAPVGSQPSIVRFTAEQSSDILDNSRFNPAHTDFFQPQNEIHVNPGSQMFQCKRKLTPEAELRPSKKHISEEKMAAHMSLLSISNEYSPPSVPQQNNMEDSVTEGKRLIMSEELLNLTSEPLLPPSLLSRLEKPSMALVLWQPPAGNIGEKLRNASLIRQQTEDERRRRQQQQQQQQQQQHSMASVDNNNTPAAIDLNTFSQRSPFLVDSNPMEL